MSKELAVTIESQGNKMELTRNMIKEYLCLNANDKEAFMFLKFCEAQNLNPFVGEAYLIKSKYAQDVQMIVGKDTFLKRAEMNPDFKGFEAGVITKDKDGKLFFKKGSFYCQETEKLVGGWAEVKKANVSAVRVEISLQEYIKKNKEGKPIMSWRIMPATMIRKVALVQALREAFPNALSACYISEELSYKDESEEATVTHEVVEVEEAVQSFNEIEAVTPPTEEVAVDSKIPMVEKDGLQQTEGAVINDIKYRVKNCLTISELENLWNEQKETIHSLPLEQSSLIKSEFNKQKDLIIEASQKKEPEALPVNPEFEEPETHSEIAEPKKIGPKQSNSIEEEYKTKNLTALRNILRKKLHEWCENDEEIRRFMYQHTKKEVLSRLTKPETIQALVALFNEMNNHEEEVDEPYIIRDFSKEPASVIFLEIERALQEAGLNLNDKENLLYEFTEGFEPKELTQKKAFSVYEKVVNHLKEIEEKNMLNKQ